jgi:hypothetical protein
MEVDSTNTPTAFAQPSPSAPGIQQPVIPNAFGVIVPGRPVRQDFVPADATGTKFALQLTSPGDLPHPLTLVNELVVFLGAPLRPNQGVMVYWQLAAQQEQTGFELLGSLTMEQPSQIFRTGWSEHDQFLSIPPNQPVIVTIGLSIEPLESVRNVSSTTSSNVNARRPMVAQRIAQDLYNFMQSFDSTGGMNGTMLVPQNIFERWWKRFESKSKRDPNFFLKNIGE